MLKLLKITTLATALIWMAGTANAGKHMVGNWMLSPGESKVAFGSIKKGKAGEVHHFSKLSGNVTPDGKVSVAIDLSSVETYADIRNERMLKFVFDAAAPKAVMSATIDPKEMNGLKAGETTSVSVAGTLSLNGKSIPVKTDMFVARLSDHKVMVTTDEMIMLSTAAAGIDAGISKLKELAKLPSITRAFPVTVRFVFHKHM